VFTLVAIFIKAMRDIVHQSALCPPATKWTFKHPDQFGHRFISFSVIFWISWTVQASAALLYEKLTR
jgi:hypothetical protein